MFILYTGRAPMSTTFLYRIRLRQILLKLQAFYKSFCADPDHKATILIVCKLPQFVLSNVEICCGFFEGQVGFFPYGDFYCCLSIQIISPLYIDFKSNYLYT